MGAAVVIGLVMAAIGLAVAAYLRSSRPDLGGVSEQWLAEHRADPHDAGS
jgi:hypothetical protein